MAEGKALEIIPTADALPFQLRVRYSATKDLQANQCLHDTVVAGSECYAVCAVNEDEGWLRLSLAVLGGLNTTLNGIKVIANIVLLDKTGSPSSTGKGSILDLAEICRGGYQLRARRNDVEANCVVDDYFVAVCSVAIIRDWPPPLHEIPNLGPHLAEMSNKQDLTDVSFNVDGETFHAHRLVLAARSLVFKAQLYGPMAESKMMCIPIQDMRASTFTAMLHYMYHGSLPSADDHFTTVDIQHLLVAADRYELEMLKEICGEKLCHRITVDTLCSTLELAEEHTCPRLKSKCLDFLTDAENFKMVATTDEYIHLVQSFPPLLGQVREMFNTIVKK